MLYVILTMVVLSAGVSTCNYALRARAETKLADCRTESAAEKVALAEANLKAIEDNAAVTERIRRDADGKRRAAEARYAKTKEELDALRKRQAVPVECRAACRDDFEPVARVMRGDGDKDAGKGAPAGGDGR